MTDRHTTHKKSIRKQLAVTLPPNRLGTHHTCRLTPRKRNQLLDPLPELRRLHVIRVPAKPGVAPTRVYGIRAWLSQAAQRGEVAVGDAVLVQEGVEHLAVEMRIPARSRDGAHIGEAPDAVRLEQRQKLLGRVRRVTDGVDRA